MPEMDLLNSGLEKTNWWVVTGGPSSGKSTLLTYMAFKGHRVIPEAARVLIDLKLSRGQTLAQIRQDESLFQDQVFDMKAGLESQLSPNQEALLERGSHGDTLAYKLLGMIWPDKEHTPPADYSRRSGILDRIESTDFLGRPETTYILKRQYAGVFILNRLPFVKDYARTEDDLQAERIDKLLHYSYRLLGYQPIDVPVAPVDQRANFIRRHIQILKTESVKDCEQLLKRW